MVLEYNEQREAAHRAVAHSTYSAALAKAQKEIQGGCQGGRGQAFWRGGQGQHLGGRSWRQG